MDQKTFPQYVFGGDSSVWDDINETEIRPNFQEAFDKGWLFNYHRTSFGLSMDTDYRINWLNSRKTKLLLGNYHFLIWTQSPEAQAEFFWNIVKNDPGELPLVVDFEWWSVIPVNAFDLLYRFLERLKKLTNKKIMIYTANSFWKQYGTKTSYWSQYMLWLAHYQTYAPIGPKYIPAPWTKCDFWQFTGHGDGRFYGMESKDVDLDYFMGSHSELLKLCGIENGQTPTTPEPSYQKMKVVATAGLKVRSSPDSSSATNKLYSLVYGYTVTVYETISNQYGKWAKISKNANEYCCISNIYGTYLQNA